MHNFRGVEQGRWISVKDMLPVYQYDVLVLTKRGDIVLTRRVAGEGWRGVTGKPVTYWMKIPREPKVTPGVGYV